ncbi:MAG: enoyl-CoA hydratase/isomerase family protein [Rhizobiaceae bacterium]|nr:enoyl-CoA hydratase/isomerase family protein [Rhizobiaceae bacterium]
MSQANNNGARPFVRLEMQGAVATVFLSNPPLNLITIEMTRQLGEHLDQLAVDPAVRALVLTGEGERAFSAGSDIKEFPGLFETETLISTKLIPENRTFAKFANFPKPTIAAIENLALGGGLELASGADLIVASSNARLGLPEVKLGSFPGSGGPIRVTRRVGPGRALEMMLLGDPIPAETALQWGLINWTAAPGAALEKARAAAAQLAEGPTAAQFACKATIRNGLVCSEEEATARSLKFSDLLSRSEDTRRGVRAFTEKKTPVFPDNLELSDFTGLY